jgi:hypothetical protein
MKKIIIISLIVAISASFAFVTGHTTLADVNTTACTTFFCPDVNWNASITAKIAPDAVALMMIPALPPQQLVNWNS